MTHFLLGFPGGGLGSILKLGALVLVTYALVLWISAIIWVYRDAKSRAADSSSQVIGVLLVAVFNVPGLIVYLVIRPQVTLADAYERSLEAEAVLHELQITANSCQTCRRPIDDDFNICPHCRTVLREPCRSCSRLVRTSWITCPYCGVDRVRPQPVHQQQAAAPSYQYREGTDDSAPPLQPPARRSSAPAAQRDLLQTVRQPSNGNGNGQSNLPNRPQPRGEN